MKTALLTILALASFNSAHADSGYGMNQVIEVQLSESENVLVQQALVKIQSENIDAADASLSLCGVTIVTDVVHKTETLEFQNCQSGKLISLQSEKDLIALLKSTVANKVAQENAFLVKSHRRLGAIGNSFGKINCVMSAEAKASCQVLVPLD